VGGPGRRAPVDSPADGTRIQTDGPVEEQPAAEEEGAPEARPRGCSHSARDAQRLTTTDPGNP